MTPVAAANQSTVNMAVSFKLEPAPWTCKCTAYVCTFWRSASQGLPADVYDPLEAESPFKASDEDYLGGLCLVQIIRYTSTPVGAYDELVICPGFFRKSGSKDKYARVSRIYVSQEDTCYNGRKNWNIPKHMAKFVFTRLESDSAQEPLLSSGEHRGLVKVEIYPHKEDASQPFFSATLTPIGMSLPYLRFSSTWLTSLGINPPLLQPPLPTGYSAEDCGTQEWKESIAKLSSSKSSIMWCDMSLVQDEHNKSVIPFLPGDARKWWAKWLIALKMEDTILEIGDATVVDVG